jgi:hypothetical protein
MSRGLVCEVEGCDRPQWARSHCGLHYKRIKAHGDPFAFVPHEQRDHSHLLGHEVSESTRKKISAAMKGTQNSLGEVNHMWKGEDIGYIAAHERIKTRRGRASEYLCADGCGRQAHDWSYSHNSDDERVQAHGYNAGRVYSLDVWAYDPRCTTCHRKFDFGRGVAS